MCLGPGTEIQGTGNLFCRNISPPICSPIIWDFFADLGGGGFESDYGTDVSDDRRQKGRRIKSTPDVA